MRIYRVGLGWGLTEARIVRARNALEYRAEFIPHMQRIQDCNRRRFRKAVGIVRMTSYPAVTPRDPLRALDAAHEYDYRRAGLYAQHGDSLTLLDGCIFNRLRFGLPY